MDDLNERLYSMFKPIVAAHGLELVDVEYAPIKGGRRLSVYIVQPNGSVSLDDCETIARALDDLLEATPELSHSYTLEVSSPGLDRVFRRKEEYSIFRGRTVSIRVREPIDKNYELEGELKGIVGEQVDLQTPAGVVSIPLANIKKTKLIFKMK